MCEGKCCKDASPEEIVAKLEFVDREELLAYWRVLPKERKDALKKKLMQLAFA